MQSGYLPLHFCAKDKFECACPCITGDELTRGGQRGDGIFDARYDRYNNMYDGIERLLQ